MKRKTKTIITVLLGLGFSLYFYQVAVHFQFICSYHERTKRDLFEKDKPLPEKNQKNFGKMKFCINLYATMFIFCDQEKLFEEQFLPNLSSAINVPLHNFQFDNMVSALGLPLCFCSLLMENNCLSKASFINCEHNFNLKHFSKYVNVLASFDNFNNSATTKYEKSNCIGRAVTWKIIKKKSCDDFKYEDVIHMISSYHRLFTDGNLLNSSHCSGWSFHIVSVFSQQNIFNILKKEIPVAYQPHSKLCQSKKISHIRIKRSLIKPSPVIELPVPTTPFLPIRASLYPLPVDSTPMFPTFKPGPPYINPTLHDFDANATPSTNSVTGTNSVVGGRNNSMQANKPMDIANASTSYSMLEQDSGSSSGEESFGSGSRLTHLTLLQSRTNLSRSNISFQPNFHTLLFEKLTTKRVPITSVTNLLESVGSTSRKVGEIIENKQTSKADVLFPSTTSHDSTTRPLLKTTFVDVEDPTKSYHARNQPKQTHFIPVTAHLINLSKSLDTDSSTSLSITSFITNDPLSYSLTATVGKIFMFDLPRNWEAYLNEPNAEINFSDKDTWLTYETQLLKIVGVPLISNQRSFALFMDVTASYLNEHQRSLSLTVQVHSKTILTKPSYMVETNFSVSAEHSWAQRRAKNAALSYTSAIFILKLSQYLTHVEADDISIISVTESGGNALEANMPHSSYVSIRWFVEKFTPKTFTKHYKPLLIYSENGEVSRNFFFALLPNFVLDSVAILEPTSQSVGSVLDMDPKFDESRIRLSVVLPIIAVLCFMLLSSIIFIIRYRRRKQRFNKDMLVDKTFAKRRKPVCLEEELEMYDFHPTKPKIFSEDLEPTLQPRNWKETIFSASCDNPSSSSVGSSTTGSDSISQRLDEFGPRNSGSYSFVNACFLPNDDCDSIMSASDACEGELASKKGD